MSKNIINTKDFNFKVKPTDDFYEYANGGWLRRTKIPGDQASWGTFSILRDINQDRLKKIVLASKSQIRDYYLSGMNQERREVIGLREIEPLLIKADSIKSVSDIMSLTGELHYSGVAPFFVPHAEQDEKNVTQYTLRLYQGGLGLPDKDYYLKSDVHSKKIRQEYEKYISKIFSLAGYGKLSVNHMTRSIMKVETALARVSMSKEDRRDPILQYNKFSDKELSRKYSHIVWPAYFRNIGITIPSNLIVSQPKFFAGLSDLLKDENLDDIKAYLKLQILSGYSSYLTSAFRRVDFDFYGKVLSGLKKQKPLWKYVVSEIDGSMGESLGKEYVKKYFSPHAKKYALHMTKNIMAAFRERILYSDWMTPSTKKKALAKLANFSVKIGYPDKWTDYRKLKITRDSFLKNHINASQFEFKRSMGKLKKKKVDRKEWHMHPQTVNAYFSPPMNEIVFPAAILTAPFFDHRASGAMNYGGIGTVIGHELTHGFDDEGSRYDKNGNLKNWWTKADRKKFDAKTSILKKYFDKIEPIKNHKINGKLTLGENIADLGGLIIAYQGYLRSLKGKKDLQKQSGKFTNAELFFINYTITERSKATEQILKWQLMNDPHSPSKYRVLGPFSHMDEFYKIFGCKIGDKMYLPEDKRARIW